MPVKQFWALTVYERATNTSIYGKSNRTTLSYNLDNMKKNTDGGLTIYVGPKRQRDWRPTGFRPQASVPCLLCACTARRKP
ncbi:DUF1214 domain-containing protein [Caballeronia novacaledonica]|uniref:DUF1214 domain-containing protein n=1 Tax=Caballeronia novacaledonica TaxID=1544861 RepID=UPI001C20C692